MNVAPLPLFHAFTAPHLGAVAAITLVISALVAWGRRLPPPRAEQAGRAIGVLLIAYYLVEAAIRVQVLHVGAIEMLPFDLCSALFFLGAWAFWSGSPLAFEVIFFWTFAGTLHSLITPTPHAGFPDLNYFQYFTAHGLLMVSATYSAVVLRHTPKQGSMWRDFGVLQAFTAMTAVVDWASGENFFYLRHKPPSPNALDLFGDWPGYLIGGEAIALLSFFLWNLPFALYRRLRPMPDGGSVPRPRPVPGHGPVSLRQR